MQSNTGMPKRVHILCTSCNLFKWLATISDEQKDKDDINCEGKTFYLKSSRSLTKAEQTQNLQSDRISTLGHSMTQVDKRGLHYQGESEYTF